MNRGDIVAAYPELIRAAEGPVMDSSCACLMRLAGAVHAQGYKVVLTGEGADEALAGYAWFKTQAIRERLNADRRSPSSTRRSGDWCWPRCGGNPATCRPGWAIRGVRTAQQDVYDLMAQGAVVRLLGRPLATAGRPSCLTTTWTSPTTAFTRWAPAEPVALRRLQGHAGRAAARWPRGTGWP